MKEKVKLGIQDLWPVALVIVVAGIGISFGLDIIDDVDDGFTADTYAANASLAASKALPCKANRIESRLTIGNPFSLA